jgi:hypothetical protein
MKELLVISGPMYEPTFTRVQLPGISADERLTPKLARQAARMACGSDRRATVWDEEADVGYRLYAQSARKLHKQEREEIERGRNEAMR